MGKEEKMESLDWNNPVIRLTQDAMDLGRLVSWDAVGDAYAARQWRESAAWDYDSEGFCGDAERDLISAQWD